MDVRVVGQVASPGVQDTHQANLAANKTRVLCQVLRCGSRNPEEQIVQQVLVAAHDFV